MNKNQQLYLVRHAESKFNLAQMIALGTTTEVRAAEDLGVKFSYDLIDCTISDLGRKQVTLFQF